MKGKKNDFSMSYWKDGVRVFFMEFVQKTEDSDKWLEKIKSYATGKKIDWDEVNIYERRTRKFIQKIKK